MSDQKTISINGVLYDAYTGMPLTQVSSQSTHHSTKPVHETASSRPASVHAKGVHQAQQRSKTLNRQLVAQSKPVTKPKQRGAAMDVRRPAVSRSPHISKFASHPKAAKLSAHAAADIAPVTHHAVAKAHAAMAKPKPAVHKPAHEIKQTAISQALEKASHKPAKAKRQKPHRRVLNVASASLAVLLLAGYFTYINMPSLSVRIAAAQAGINASYPEYRPVGYRLNGPVAYKEGEVAMEFASNSGPQTFALSQSKSSWDSSALLENYVQPNSEGKYATYSDAGLTVYTYGNNAAWVNGGILYTIEGSATLSNEQVRRIATSM